MSLTFVKEVCFGMAWESLLKITILKLAMLFSMILMRKKITKIILKWKLEDKYTNIDLGNAFNDFDEEKND